MKSKIVRGIINGGVLAAVAALGITVYQLGTKPIVENSQEENSVQMEEELSMGKTQRTRQLPEMAGKMWRRMR